MQTQHTTDIVVIVRK